VCNRHREQGGTERQRERSRRDREKVCEFTDEELTIEDALKDKK
jgi:hypothetical protein